MHGGAIASQRSVVCEETHGFDNRLGEEDAVERVRVVSGQILSGGVC